MHAARRARTGVVDVQLPQGPQRAHGLGQRRPQWVVAQAERAQCGAARQLRRQRIKFIEAQVQKPVCVWGGGQPCYDKRHNVCTVWGALARGRAASKGTVPQGQHAQSSPSPAPAARAPHLSAVSAPTRASSAPLRPHAARPSFSRRLQAARAGGKLPRGFSPTNRSTSGACGRVRANVCACLLVLCVQRPRRQRVPS